MNRDGSNGGLIFNSSEAGLALSSAWPLFEDQLIDLRVQFSGSSEQIDLTGQIVWKSESKKEAGIKFIGLQDEALQRLRGWIAEEALPSELHFEANTPLVDLPEKTLPRMKTWIFSEASRGETSWQEAGPPGSPRNASQDVRNRLLPSAQLGETSRQEIASRLGSLSAEGQDVKNRLFPEALLGAPPLDSKRSTEEQPALPTETKDMPSPLNAPPANTDAVRDEQFSAANTSTDLNVPLNSPETEVAQPSSPQTEQISTKQKQPLAETRLSLRDRRSHPRIRIIPFGYLQMDESNGGIVLNISKGGVSITTAAVLTADHLPTLNVQFPDVSGWIEASGEIAWRSESKKEAGVRFVGITEEAQQRIGDWISAQATAYESQEQEQILRISEKQDEQLKITDLFERGNLVSVPPALADETRKLEVASLFSSASASSLQTVETQTTAPEALASSRKPHRKPIRFRRRWAHIQRETSGWRPGRRTLVALLMLTFSSLAFWKWVLPSGDVRTEITAAGRPQTEPGNEALKKPATLTMNTTPGAPSVQVEKKNPQSYQVEPLLAKNMTESLNDRSPGNPQPRLPATRLSAKPIPNAASRSTENLLASKQEKRPSWNVAASVNAHPIKAPQAVSGALPAAPQLEAGLVQPANPAPLTTTTSQPVAPKTKEPAILPAKQPATPAAYTGAVGIVADPYPALRLPDGHRSKKQRQAASLQLGHLLSRVEPVYPEEAKQQGIQGTVRLHAIIDRHGTVENVASINGPTVLVTAAMNAVRHWRYTETLLAGQSVETEEDITVIFRLSNSATPEK